MNKYFRTYVLKHSFMRDSIYLILYYFQVINYKNNHKLCEKSYNKYGKMCIINWKFVLISNEREGELYLYWEG